MRGYPPLPAPSGLRAGARYALAELRLIEGDPRRRELLLKLAREWTEDAERLGVDAID